MGEQIGYGKGFNGMVGGDYGAKWKNKTVIKTVPFSHTPHNTIQNNSWSAFTCLNRFSSAIAKNFWQYLSLSNKKMQKHNAVARWLKAMIQDYTFTVGGISRVIEATGQLELPTFTFSAENQEFLLKYKNTFTAPPNTNPMIFFGVFANNGKDFGTATTYGTGGEVIIPTKYDTGEPIIAVAFITYKHGIHRVATALAINADPALPFFNETWFPENMINGDWTYTDPETIKGVNVDYKVDGEKLTFAQGHITIKP